MTPREIAIFADGVNERTKEEHKRALYIARLTAWMHRCDAKEFPSYESLIPKPPMTRHEYALMQRERMDDLKNARNAMLERQERSKRADEKAARKAKAKKNG